MDQERKCIKILDVFIDILTMDVAIERIDSWINDCKKRYVCVAPVSTIVDAISQDDYREVINNADMVAPDGVPIVWVSRVKGCKEIKRVCGPDMMKKICTDLCLTHRRHFFFGATGETLEQASNYLRVLNPDIKICGTLAPPFRDKAIREKEEVVKVINDAQPDIIWVGIGSPKQDFWMSLNRDQLDAPVLIGVGAAFDFLAEKKTRAPRWMQKIGMEWFFRLCCEPRRLWKRYLFGNTKFVFELFKEVIGIRKKI